MGPAVKLARAGLKTKPLIVKLSPNVTDITEMARCAEDSGADAVSLINTITGMVIDTRRRRPVLGNITGGLSGPAVRPVAVRMVYQTSRAVKIPVVGLGGIEKLDDALQFFIAGASAVQIGTATFYEPRTAETIAEGLERYMAENGFASIADLRGDF